MMQYCDVRRDEGGDEAETRRRRGRLGDYQGREQVSRRRGRDRGSCLGPGAGTGRRNRDRSESSIGGRDEERD